MLKTLVKLYANAALAIIAFTGAANAQSTLSAANIAAAARSSSLHIRTVPAANIAQFAARQLNLGNGITMRFDQYLRASSLNRTARISELNRGNFDRYLQNRAQLSETVSQLQDRMVINRVAKFNLKPGVCLGRGKLPAALTSVCFRPKARSGRISRKLRQDIRNIRSRLASRGGNGNAFPGISVAQALNMNDARLLDAMVNSGEKEIRHVSVIPLKSFVDRRVGIIPLLRANSRNFNRTVQVPRPRDFRRLAAINPRELAPPVRPVDPVPRLVGREAEPTINFSDRQFLTGFTFGHEIADTYEITLARKTWFSDRYFIRLSYEFSAGFGLRIPFFLSVEAKSAARQLVSATNTTQGRRLKRKPGRNVRISGNVVNVDRDGNPSYRAVGLGQSQYFEGNELVFGFSASCSFYASIPGPDISYNCPSIGKSYSKNFNPVIGRRNSSKLPEFWIRGNDIGFGYGLNSRNGAWVDVGVGATITNGQVGFKISPINGSVLRKLPSRQLWIASNRQKINFTVAHRNYKNSKGSDVIGFKISDPNYKFNVNVTPSVRLRLMLDLGIYVLNKTIGPFALDSLSITQSFTLGPHDKTVSSYEFRM